MASSGVANGAEPEDGREALRKSVMHFRLWTFNLGDLLLLPDRMKRFIGIGSYYFGCKQTQSSRVIIAVVANDNV